MKVPFLFANVEAPATQVIPATAPAGSEVVQTAADAAAQTPPPAPNMLMQMLPFVIIMGAMIFLMVRSQKKQQQKQQNMLETVVKGSRVRLHSGMFGTIVEVRPASFLVEIAKDTQVEVIKGGIAEVIPADAPKA